MYAPGEYIGVERVNHALRRLREKHSSGAPPLPTTLDLYRELQLIDLKTDDNTQKMKVQS